MALFLIMALIAILKTVYVSGACRRGKHLKLNTKVFSYPGVLIKSLNLTVSS